MKGISIDNIVDVSPEKIFFLLARAGLSNEEIGSVLGLSPHQIFDFLENNPHLREILEEGREEPNFQVEQALFKRALGYQVREVVMEDGKPKKVVIKEIAPDPVSCIFWLKNRSPKKWRDVIEMKFSLKDRMGRAHDALSRNNGKALGKGGDGDEG